jgi:hypothetical protein
VNQKLSAISEYLEKQGLDAVYSEGDVDYEIDLFLFLSCRLVEPKSGRYILHPYYIGIECDGHDYHERTKAQAAKDRSKDRRLKFKGLDVLRFTGSEITRSPERCVDEVDDLITAEFRRMKQVLDRV